MRWLVLAALWLGQLSMPGALAASLRLPVFNLQQLEAPSPAVLEKLSSAMEQYGVFAVHGPPGSRAAEALQAYASCVEAGSLDGLLNKVEMEDHTLRSTLATSTEAGVAQPLPSAVGKGCPQFAPAASQLRAAVESVGQAYARVLDTVMYGGAACSSPSQCFTGAVKQAESLEHFHVFHRPAAKTPVSGSMSSQRRSLSSASVVAAEENILSMHSDIGLFLVMTAAQYYAAGAAAQGGPVAVSGSSALDLQVELRDGSIAELLFPADALLVMNGEGLSRWMQPSSAGRVQPWTPMHEVLNKHMAGRVRAWFGRMYFPARTSQLQVSDSSNPHPITFHQYRQQTYAAFRDGKAHLASTLGCGPTRRLLQDEGSCAANQVYCWMSCMNIPSTLTCNKSQIICQNIKDGTLWPQDYIIPSSGKANHCFDCALACPASTQGGNSSSPSSSPPAAGSSSGFCNTRLQPTTMWMTGFQFAYANHDSPCVVYLFPEWVLDSAVKFAWACIGTFLLGLVVGSLTKLRLGLQRRWLVEGCTELLRCIANQTVIVCVAQASIILIIAVQILLGYCLMLVAMTYQAELFIMVVLGLAMGHLFNLPQLAPQKLNGGSGKSQSSASSASKSTSRDLEVPLEPCCAA